MEIPRDNENKENIIIENKNENKEETIYINNSDQQNNFNNQNSNNNNNYNNNYQNNSYNYQNQQNKQEVGIWVNQLVYALLAILLGGLGIHKFYTKNVVVGFIYLLTAITGIPSIIATIEGIIALTKKTNDKGEIFIKKGEIFIQTN